MRCHWVIAVLATVEAASLASCSGSAGLVAKPAPKPVPMSKAAASSPDLLLRDAQLIRLSHGKTIAVARADELVYRRAGGQFEASNVRATLLPGPQAHALESFGAVEVKAPRVVGEESQEGAHTTAITRGEGGVTAQAARGDQARGESVVWNGASGLLQSDAPVTLSGPNYSMRGGSLKASTDGQQFELGRGAQGTISRPQGAP